MGGLTVKQKVFCEYFASSGNATQAAIQAGYSGRTANVIGSENLAKPCVWKYLESLTKGPEEQRILTAVERQKMLSFVIRGTIKDSFVTREGTIVERPAKLSNRIRAAELLARMRGELRTTHSVEGEVTLRKIVRRYDGS